MDWHGLQLSQIEHEKSTWPHYALTANDVFAPLLSLYLLHGFIISAFLKVVEKGLQMEDEVSSHKLKRNTFIDGSPCARNVFFKTSFEVGLLIPILQMKTLRHRKVVYSAKYTPSK